MQPDSPLKEHGKTLQLVKDLKMCMIKWRSPHRIEKLIAVFNHSVINLYFTANKRTMYTSYYDEVHELL